MYFSNVVTLNSFYSKPSDFQYYNSLCKVAYFESNVLKYYITRAAWGEDLVKLLVGLSIVAKLIDLNVFVNVYVGHIL